MKKTKEQLMEDLKVHQKNVKSNLIKNNKKLKESLEKKIKDLEQEIENYVEEKAPAIDDKPKVEKPKVEKPSVEKPKAEKAPKVEKPKVEKPSVEKPKVEKPKVEKPKVEKPAKKEKPNVKSKEKKGIGRGEFEVGDNVSFIKKSTGQKIVGKITRIYEYADTPGKFIAVVTDKSGKKHQPTISPSLVKM